MLFNAMQSSLVASGCLYPSFLFCPPQDSIVLLDIHPFLPSKGGQAFLTVPAFDRSLMLSPPPVSVATPHYLPIQYNLYMSDEIWENRSVYAEF